MKTSVKRTLAALLAFMLICGLLPVAVFAANDNGVCGDGVYWSFSNGTLSITGSGEIYNMDEYGSGNTSPWVEAGYKDAITKVEMSDGITRIGRSRR